MTSLSDYDISNPCDAVVKETTRITPVEAPEVRHILMQVPSPAFSYIEGQSIGVLVPGPHAFGNEHHLRLYSIANARDLPKGDGAEIALCVRRCFYIDEVSGEQYPGIASHFLCDARPGDKITITGPYGSQFRIPTDKDSNLLMIGTGTGIAPFRAFIQNIYEKQPGWKGKVHLYYGARTGLEVLYRNDQKDDLANYYDEKTFAAFQGLSSRSWMDEGKAISRTLEDNAEEIWKLILDPKTYVYLAGLEKISQVLNKVMAGAAGSEERWRWTRQELVEQKRWGEILYI